MKFSDLFPSNYLKQEDVQMPVNLVIARLALENVGNQREQEEKPVLYFQRTEKGLVLNRTNGDTLVDAFGDDSDNWIGKTIQLYVDPSVKMGRERVGGLRLRAVANQTNGKEEFWTVETAKNYAVRRGVNWDDVKSHLTALGHGGWYPPACTSVAREYIDKIADASITAIDNAGADETVPF